MLPGRGRESIPVPDEDAPGNSGDALGAALRDHDM
jgi:hypothetical protein